MHLTKVKRKKLEYLEKEELIKVEYKFKKQQHCIAYQQHYENQMMAQIYTASF